MLLFNISWYGLQIIHGQVVYYGLHIVTPNKPSRVEESHNNKGYIFHVTMFPNLEAFYGLQAEAFMGTCASNVTQSAREAITRGMHNWTLYP